ncbi:MAG: pilus assembly protein PilM [Candidatus Omnitrophota bacterium]
MKRLIFLPKIGAKEQICIDFTGNNLRIAHAESFSHKVSDVDLISRDISGMADEDISKAIKDFLAKLKPKAVDIINIIPSHIVITKNIEIPSRDPQEIKEIVNLQAGRHTPYSREEIIVDYVDIGTYKDSYTKVLLVIVTRNIIKRQFNILRAAGLKTEKIYFAPECIGRFVSMALKLDSENAPSGIVHIDQSFTDFTVVFKKKLLYARSIPIGIEHLTRERQSQEVRLVDEIKNSLENYQTEGIDKMPRRIIFTGAIEEIKDMEEILGSSFHMPVNGFDYLKDLHLKHGVLESPSFDKRISFLNVSAPLFSLGEIKVNLIPEETKLRKAFEEKSRDIVKAGIMALVSFVLICCILISKIYFKSNYFNGLDKEFQAQYKEVGKLEKDFEKVKAVKEYISNRGYSLEALSELYTLLSEQMMISDVRFDDQKSFSVKGTARTMSSIFSLVDSMEKSSYFKNVNNRYATKRKEGAEDVADFEIVCELEENVK